MYQQQIKVQENKLNDELSKLAENTISILSGYKAEEIVKFLVTVKDDLGRQYKTKMENLQKELEFIDNEMKTLGDV